MAPSESSTREPRVSSPVTQTGAEPSRLVPLAVAGGMCFIIALALGYGGWYLLNERRSNTERRGAEYSTQNNTLAPTPPAVAPTPAEEQIVHGPAGEVEVPGGEIMIGGDGSNMPLQREITEPFAIAETEVTNAEYQGFLKATNHQSPQGWKDGEFPPGTANLPVVNVSWVDATAYCQWLSEKLKATVRLPTEAEWELAAGGGEKRRYPWGSEWDDHAAACVETKGRVTSVKSYPAGQSPYGAYDMAGNVWEWTADQAKDKDGQFIQVKDKNGQPVENGAVFRIAKGGAADEPKTLISIASRQAVVETLADSSLGFRYLIVRKK